MVNFKEFILEQEEVAQMPKGDRTCTVLPGRFVIPHKAHIAMFRQAWNKFDVDKLLIAVVMGKKSSHDKERNPTNFRQRKEYVNQVLDIPHKVIKVSSAWLGEVIKGARQINLEPKYLVAGPDRYHDTYHRMAVNYKDKLNSDIEVVQRDPISVEGVRGTALRKAIRSGNKQEFQRMAPPALHNRWDELQDILELD